MSSIPAPTLISQYIKFLLKENKYTYNDLALHLNISEGSVKRIFKEESFSIERLEQIAKFFGIDLFDLMSNAKKRTSSFYTFSETQENALLKNPMALYILILLTTGHDLSSIKKKTKLSSDEVKKSLYLLDKINVIELFGDNKIKLKSRSPYIMQKNGELRKVLKNNLLNFICKKLRGEFDGKNQLICGEFYLTKKSLQDMRKDLESIYNKYAEICQKEISMVRTEKVSPVVHLIYNNSIDGYKQVISELSN